MPPSTLRFAAEFSLALFLFLAAALGEGSPAQGDERTVLDQLDKSLHRYTTAETWGQRRQELREQFLKGAQLWPLPSARPAVPYLSHSYRAHPGYSVENVALETWPGFYCTGNLYRPLGRHDRTPAILCPHGHFRPLGRMREEHQIRCAQLARMGATVLSYGMVGWNDSSQTTHDDPYVLALQTWNSLRAVDFLVSQPRVDGSRIGVTGASGGGTQSLYLTLIDDRITASAPLVIVYPWSAPEGCRCEGGMPVMEAAQTNAIELAAATGPRPQLIISVGNDPTQDFPQVGYPFIQRMYEVAGAKDAISHLHLEDEAHDFGVSKRRAVYSFFAKQLQLGLDTFAADSARGKEASEPSEDLNHIVIETPEALAVFDDNHPLPAHAVQGAEQVDVQFRKAMQDFRAVSSPDSVAKLEDAPPVEYVPVELTPADEALIFTPPGFSDVGEPAVANGLHTGTITLVVRDDRTASPTCCRVNVVGADGNYYQPQHGPLLDHSLTGKWPQSGWGNRAGKAPSRYLGCFFYSAGESTIEVPAGPVRIEVWKGFEYRPETVTTYVSSGAHRPLEISLRKPVSMPEHGYWSGDPHIHMEQRDAADQARIFDLLEAEDIRYGALLAYNEPAGPYQGTIGTMDAPQLFGLGKRSTANRGDYWIQSGQEYRSSTYGHLNLFGLDQLVLEGESINANDWPPFGHVARDARQSGGVAFYAHGGYAQEVYADVAQGNIDGVELLQFGIYRGIGLRDWYHMLNAGFRVPANGACDYPACRKLGDCKTFVYATERPDMQEWLQGMAAGRSFFTTGPLVLIDVDGEMPGEVVDKVGEGPHRVHVHIRVRSEVAPVTHVDMIANGRVVANLTIPVSQGRGNWIDLEQTLELDRSAWIAARAYSSSVLGTPDAEAHTNPVYVYLNGRAPFDRESVDAWLTALDGQIAAHKKREFAKKAQLIAYFEQSRDILVKLREAGGVAAHVHPSKLAESLPQIDDPGARAHTEEELKAFLQPIPPKPIDEVLASFDVVDGFKMQLVAMEPFVTDPIAATFDEQGNLYVCEMRDYPFKPREGQPPIGRVTLLRDIDGDGDFDDSHVFADQLLWAGGIACWKGGVFVAAPPDIWYLKDTDGDHHADIRRRVFTGFGVNNQQAMLNNLQWGLDHKIYGATAGNGGQVRLVELPEPDAASPNRDTQQPSAEDLRAQEKPIDLNGRDFRFDPATGKLEPVTGTVQFGNTFDDWDNRFVCSESQPLKQVALPEDYLVRNPYLPTPETIHNAAPGPVPVFRISPLERWRMIRSSRRIAHGTRSADSPGASHHVIDAAAGVTVYRGGTYPPSYYGTIFVGEAQNNLIHHRKLLTDGILFQSERVESNTEFVRSSDNWFRPVNFINAPDGTLYVLDMCREILESIHVPLDVWKLMDFRHGRENGRIYRIATNDFRYPGPPSLGTANLNELVAALESPHGWWRDTAHRLLHERQDPAADRLLQRLLRETGKPETRVHALWLLQGRHALTTEDVLLAFADPHPWVRVHALRLAESMLSTEPALGEKISAMATDPDIHVRFQLAFTLGEWNDPRQVEALAALCRSDAADPSMQTAILSSCSKNAGELARRLLEDKRMIQSPHGGPLLRQLATVIGARQQREEIASVLHHIATHQQLQDTPGLPSQLLLWLGQALQRNGADLPLEDVDVDVTRPWIMSTLERARQTASNRDVTLNERLQAIQLCVFLEQEARIETLLALVNAAEVDEIQTEAIRGLGTRPSERVTNALLERWRGYSPEVAKAVMQFMLTRSGSTQLFLQAIEQGMLPAGALDASARDALLKHRDAAIRERAQQVLASRQTLGSRAEVIAGYRASVTSIGDVERGAVVFRSNCQTCHKLGDIGFNVGPNLASSAARDMEALLTHILDPNHYVDPRYMNYIAVDDQGRIMNGILTSQTATSVTLTREEGRQETILRHNLDELASTGSSLMPEGFEQKIDVTAMADLLAFLQSQLSEAEPPLDIGTLPGLVEPAPASEE